MPFSSLEKGISGILRLLGSKPFTLPDHALTVCFQVQLILEYCNRGCLRDALDSNAYLSASGGLNYAAILDTTIDIARAMLHLHCNNVLHMDLKARNVMLTSSGTEGKGVTCKVADFGKCSLLVLEGSCAYSRPLRLPFAEVPSNSVNKILPYSKPHLSHHLMQHIGIYLDH